MPVYGYGGDPELPLRGPLAGRAVSRTGRARACHGRPRCGARAAAPPGGGTEPMVFRNLGADSDGAGRCTVSRAAVQSWCRPLDALFHSADALACANRALLLNAGDYTFRTG